MRTHYAEADNELHHLLIMESLGGNENVVDRILAQSMVRTFGYMDTYMTAFHSVHHKNYTPCCLRIY